MLVMLSGDNSHRIFFLLHSLSLDAPFEPIHAARERKLNQTRMHSSRMRTVHSSSRLFLGGLPQCMLGYQPQGQTTPFLGAGTYRDQAPHRPCGQTHACKNITFATSLRTVKIKIKEMGKVLLTLSIGVHGPHRFL